MIPEDVLVAYLGIDPDDTDAVALAVDFADRMLAWVENQTQRYFREPKEFVERLSGDGTTALWIREMPVMDGESVPEPVLSVEVRKGGMWDLVSEDDYDLIDYLPVGPHLLEHVTRWPIGRRNIRVIYESGYDRLPGDIEQLILEVTGHTYRERGKEGLRSESIGGYSYTRADAGGEDEFRDRWKSTIEIWRHTVFA